MADMARGSQYRAIAPTVLSASRRAATRASGAIERVARVYVCAHATCVHVRKNARQGREKKETFKIVMNGYFLNIASKWKKSKWLTRNVGPRSLNEC